MLTLRRKDLVCQQAVELVTDYLEGSLSRRDRRRFEAHLRACPNCSAYLEQIRATIALGWRRRSGGADVPTPGRISSTSIGDGSLNRNLTAGPTIGPAK